MTTIGHISIPQVNVLLLGLAFMLIFTGYITMAGIQVSLPWLYRCLSSGNDIIFTSLTILTLQTIIFASASTPGSGGYVPGFKVLACSSSVPGIQNVSLR